MRFASIEFLVTSSAALCYSLHGIYTKMTHLKIVQELKLKQKLNEV